MVWVNGVKHDPSEPIVWEDGITVSGIDPATSEKEYLQPGDEVEGFRPPQKSLKERRIAAILDLLYYLQNHRL